MTLRALAEKISVSAPFLSDLEHGRRHTNQLDRLAEALDVPEEELTRFDPRIPTDVKDFLAENPQLITLLKDLRDSGRPVPLEALRAASKKTR
jgi:transcriptional regulator with XRE-family HTH domain